LVPTGSGGDDLVGIGGPGEGLWLLVVIEDEAIDGGLEIDDALEDAALQAPLGEDGEETLDGVEPAGRSWREVEGPTRMTPGNDRLGSVGKEPLVNSGEHNHVWRQKQSSSVGGSARRLSETWHRSR
jgi:hypothetical protein